MFARDRDAILDAHRELVHAAVREVRLAGDEEVAVGDGLGLAAQATSEQAVAAIVEVELVHGASGPKCATIA